MADPPGPPGTGLRAPGPGLSEPGPRIPDPGLSDPASSGHRPPATGHASPQEPPPFGRSWAALYAAVAGALAVVVALLALFTRAFE